MVAAMLPFESVAAIGTEGEPPLAVSETSNPRIGLAVGSSAEIASVHGPLATPAVTGVAKTDSVPTETKVRARVPEVAPEPFETETLPRPGEASSEAGTTADSWVADEKVVFRAVLFRLTTALEMKFVPVTVIVVSGAPVAITPGVTEAMVGTGGGGGVIMPAPDPDDPPQAANSKDRPDSANVQATIVSVREIGICVSIRQRSQVAAERP